MLTQTCILKFNDGATAKSVLTAETPYGRNLVEYSGAVDRLKGRPEKSAPQILRAYFQEWAWQHHADFIEHLAGEYDYAE